MSIAAAQTNEEDEPSSLYDNPDIEFLLPNIPIPELAFCLANEEEPIAKRMRSVFLLKQFGKQSDVKLMAIDALLGGMGSQSVLLKHEIAYCLGQLQEPYAAPSLEKILQDSTEHSIVRHECAEALAAIGLASSLELLSVYARDFSIPVEVRETCQLSLDMIAWRASHPAPVRSKYMSVDPAPPFPKKEARSLAELENILLDSSRSMFERYRAMFSLRNMETVESVEALAKGLKDESALFRHEIAFVFGQMQHKASIPALKEALALDAEHPMVRHEAAEALGSVGASHACEDQVVPLLQRYVESNAVASETAEDTAIVRESCEVALDIREFWTDGEQFGGDERFHA